VIERIYGTLEQLKLLFPSITLIIHVHLNNWNWNTAKMSIIKHENKCRWRYSREL